MAKSFRECLTPVHQAIERVKDMLFRPFDLHRWIAIGFTAWLATLADGGGGGGGGGGNFGGGQNGGGIREHWDQGMEWVHENLNWLVPVIVVGVVVAVTVGLVMLWLSSRGRFMFLHNVARNRADVVAPWHAYRTQGNSLFLFRLVLGAIGFCTVLPFLGIAGFAALPMIREETILPVAMTVAILATLAAIVVGICLLVIEKLTKDFVVPIMFLRTPRCRAAWGEFFRLLSSRPVDFILYLLFYILLSIAVGIGVLALVLITCCLAACFLAIPYVGTVVLLPVFVFYRAYSACFLAQFGPEFDVFGGAGPTAPMTSTGPNIAPPAASPAPPA